jgi:MFS family permease
VSEIAMMVAMPIVFRMFSVRAILLLGLGSWALRYILLGGGDAGSGVWMFYLAIILHGVCFDFFFVTGQLYTDQEAPSHLRSTAQGFITVVTYGFGMLVGSLLSGYALDYFSSGQGEAIVRDWQSFWLSSAAMSAAIGLLVVFFFRSPARIRAKNNQPAAAEATA